MELRPDNNYGSDLVDPLADYPPSYLFPRSLNPSSSNPNSSFSDPFDAKLQSRVLSSPNKMFEQAKAILEGSADHLNADKTDISSENEMVSRKKRPGLGLKPPKFVMKPMSREPAVIVNHSVDFSKLSDPDEYFDAFERLENAKKEMRRLRGEPVLNLNLNCLSMAPRPKRPGLSGNSGIFSQLTYPSFKMPDVNENRLPSQETLMDAEILSPAHHDDVPDDNVMNTSSNSKATTTGKVSELDEILALNYEGLDDDGIQNLLLEKLQIKSVDIDSLPDWRTSIRKSLAATTALPKTSDILNRPSRASKAVSRMDMKSPAKSKSPLASISMLNRHIAKRNTPNDLYPSLCFDFSPEKGSIPTREPEKSVDQAGQSDDNALRENMCNVRGSPVHEQEDTAGSGEDSIFSAAKDVYHISEPKDKEVVVEQLDQIGNQTGWHEDKQSPVHEKENILVSDVGPTSQPDKQNNEVAAVQESAEQQFISEAQDMENSSFNEAEKDGMDEPSNVDKNFVEELTKKTRFSKRKSAEKRKSETLSVSEEPAKKGKQAKSSQSDMAVSKETRSKKGKVEGAKARVIKGDRKFVSERGRRFSLRDAGLSWNVADGVRRSTRLKLKPLDFWSNQRYLYARVHESLPTVIGVKYASPSKEAEPEIQVKSFVSDEYNDLVNHVALH